MVGNVAPACVSPNDGYIYCVGGQTSTGPVYTAPLTSSGIGTWTLQTHSYPINVELNSCVTYLNDIYCIAGGKNNAVVVNNVYYSTSASGTVGSWTATTPFPTNNEMQRAAVSNEVFCPGYCGAGVPRIYQSYAATLSSTGVGQWSASAPIPVSNMRLGSCVTANFRILWTDDTHFQFTNQVFSANAGA